MDIYLVYNYIYMKNVLPGRAYNYLI